MEAKHQRGIDLGILSVHLTLLPLHRSDELS